MAITITIQAASDAMMTDNCRPVGFGGTALADDDLRKMYGLPNQYIGTDDKIHFVHDPRWDNVYVPSMGMTRRKYKNSILQSGEDEKTDLFESEELNNIANAFQGIHRPPTTTAFQLRCNSITHDAQDMTTVAPMPGVNNSAGIRQDAGTPGQLNNLVIALGLRSEIIKLEGVLVDEGIISASNPRKQVLLNIARLQYFKTGRSGSKNSWGGAAGGPLNPRSYPCLTIFDSDLNDGYDDSYQIVQPSGTNLSYRGLIKSFAFRQEGGRPNQWFWTMEFQVLQNEWPQGQHFMGKGVLDGILRINRIRLVNMSDRSEVTSFPLAANVATIEVRTEDLLALPIQFSDGRIAETVQSIVTDPQLIFITNSDSVPKIDGKWQLYDIDYDAKTFLIRNVGSAIVNDDFLFGDEYSYYEPLATRAWTAFTNGGDGYLQANPEDSKDGSLLMETGKITPLNEVQASEPIYDYLGL